MGRVFLKPGSLYEVKQCPSCGYQDDMVKRTLYRISDDDLAYEDDYSHYFTYPGEEVTRYRCGNCDEWCEEPEQGEGGGVYVCAECKEEYDDEDDATECCD